ncbi:molybdopterin biosynthesis protein MoeB [Roseivivax jejudonensis]|uniref:Molybdopterin biosynthesis protein MoeB n=1 Tax=Roseivivax jejudonensis TaxID=1529041 RepID=A0A1X6Z2Y8_9RHOB|nr:rhodanese-like domain-containing protein [Roseivivax jejudonensis]SLN37076.1 molybdopterin biosynthesis protein MoeB [Roseivivax jejudonensis]
MKSSAQMVAEARARIHELDTAEVMDLHGRDDVVIVDIRDVRERQKTGWIPGSVHAPRGMLEFWVDPDSPYHRPVFARPDARYILHCASGWRSALATATLADMGFEAAHLRDGFTDWLAQDGPVEMPDDDERR